MKLYMHCGAGKTGTTSFQEIIQSQADVLCHAGIFVPKQAAEWQAGNGEYLYYCLDQGEIDQTSTYLSELINNAYQYNCNSICISCELLIDLPLAQKIKLFMLLNGIFDEVMVVACFRNPSDWIISAYFQQTSEHANVEDLDSDFFSFAAQNISTQLAGIHELVSVANEFECTYQLVPYLPLSRGLQSYTMHRLIQLLCGTNLDIFRTLIESDSLKVRRRVTKPWTTRFAGLELDNSSLRCYSSYRNMRLSSHGISTDSLKYDPLSAIVPISYAQYKHYLHKIFILCAQNGLDPLEVTGANHLYFSASSKSFLDHIYLFVTDSFRDHKLASIVLSIFESFDIDPGHDAYAWAQKVDRRWA